MTNSLYERTVPGLHQRVLLLVQRLVPPPATVLDAGAGTGAWAQRIAGHGYEVRALEQDVTSFAAELPVTLANLNLDFAALVAARFDLVTAIEVIEHLENPRHFLRESAKLLAPGGKLIITTPNIESPVARLRFLLTGELRHFGRDASFSDPTHITPIHSLLMERMAADTGLRITNHSTYNAQVTSRASSRAIAALFRPAMKNAMPGDNHIFVLEKKDSALCNDK